MIIPHNTLILVADGQKFLFLRNEGDLNQPVIKVEASGEQPGQPTHSHGTDQPGRAFSSVGSMRSAMEQTDFHQIEKDQFAAKTAALLAARAQASDFEKLIVVAPPRTLAELRKRYDPAVTARLVAEVDKDLTRHPVHEIAQILSR
ncbi:MAG: host attachment family protein [Sphingobium sp.]